MALYTTVAVLVVTLLFCVNLTFFNRINLLSKNSIFVISLASIVISISFPLVLNGFIKTSILSNFNFALFTSIITCSALIVIMSLIISYMAGDEESGGKLANWKYSMFLQAFQKSDYCKELITSENTSFSEVQSADLSIQGKNILEKSVDTEQNIDTMGIETFNSESLFLDVNIANQMDNKASECCSEYMDNLSITAWDSGSNSTENIGSNSFVDDYEVYEDYFEEEVLDEFQCDESKYCSENGQIAEKKEVEGITSICDEVKSDTILQNELINEYEDEYLDKSLDIVFNEIILDDIGQDEMHTDFDGSDYELSEIKEIDAVDEVFELVAAHMDEFVEENETMSVESPQPNAVKSVDESIDEAFGLKEKGDFEGAILSFFYALDNGPSDDVVFWIVLDICVLYKQLGQVELAREVLESYISQFGEIMDEAVRHEIELNLQ
ncbi:tetratricopeptide repeat protein [Acetivibrio cellulolyticus]|uniref:tetratricopeptide repeat protein n=1 Tax=Acetivibrio cellulolyticus TaxID=35830 RepID=UPI0001E2E75C|nr:hypothetical protein [Acetivibrio cellulolyticus]